MELNGIEKSKHIASTKNFGKYFPSQFNVNVKIRPTHLTDMRMGWVNGKIVLYFLIS